MIEPVAPNDLDWPFFERNRTAWLGLVSADEFRAQLPD